MSEVIETEINELVDLILDDYKKDRFIDRVNNFNQIDKDIIKDIIYKLRQIFLPGFFSNKKYHTYTAKNNLSMLLEDVMYNLEKQIVIVLQYDTNFKDSHIENIYEEAHRISLEFFKKIPMIREYLETDLEAFYDGDPAAYCKDEIVFSYPGLFAIMVNRVAHELHLLGVPLIPRIMTEYAHSRTGIDIHPGAKLGKYFFIDHGTGIVIGETTEIGNNVKIYQGVTLGALSTRGGQSLKSKKRHPTIEDNVTIYSGASILGGDTVIGHDVVIGGNAFITKSIPAGTKVSIKQQELKMN